MSFEDFEATVAEKMCSEDLEYTQEEPGSFSIYNGLFSVTFDKTHDPDSIEAYGRLREDIQLSDLVYEFLKELKKLGYYPKDFLVELIEQLMY